MSSSEAAGGVRRVVVDSGTYRVLFQLTKELANMPDSYLSAAGMTREDAAELGSLARALRADLRDESRILISVANDVKGFMYGQGSDDSGPSVHPDDRSVTFSSTAFMAWHASLLQVAEWLRGRELFLRTGYSDEEAAQAIDAICP